MFACALCDMLQKDWKWRNSIDVIDVKASSQVQRERVKDKGKWCSLSDKDVDKPSSMYHIYNSQIMWFKQSTGSGTSLRLSQAITFDMLHEWLTNSQTQLMNQVPPFDDHMSIGGKLWANSEFDWDFCPQTKPEIEIKIIYKNEVWLQLWNKIKKINWIHC